MHLLVGCAPIRIHLGVGLRSHAHTHTRIQAKSAKAAPVMAGSVILGGAKYSVREYLQVAAIIAGSAIVSMGKKKKGGVVENSTLGVVFIVLSLVCDGVTYAPLHPLEPCLACCLYNPQCLLHGVVSVPRCALPYRCRKT